MSKKSAGILVYRITNGSAEFFLVHPGGPFWSKKDEGAWSIPKGEFDDDEPALDAAKREFYEETGFNVEGNFLPLSQAKQKSGKTVHAFAVESDVDCTEIRSNSFEMEWPPRSGKKQFFPEVDRAAWFDLLTAKKKILEYQLPLLEELAAILQDR